MKKNVKSAPVVPQEMKRLPASKPQRRKPVRQRLFDAALTLFSIQGVDATTIDQIVEAADVAKGSFYNYFQDRNGVMLAIAAELRSRLEGAIARLNDGIEDPAERVARAIRLYLALAVLDPGRAGMLARVYDGKDDLIMQSNPGLTEDLKVGIAQGRFNVPNVEVATHLTIGIALTSMRHLLSNTAGEEILRGQGHAYDVATMLLQGLGVVPGDIREILDRPFAITQLTLAF